MAIADFRHSALPSTEPACAWLHQTSSRQLAAADCGGLVDRDAADTGSCPISRHCDPDYRIKYITEMYFGTVS